MGTDYYIVNHKTKKIFELGRGFWYDWYVEGGIEFLFDKDLCADLLCNLVDEMYYYYDKIEIEKMKEYYSKFPVLFLWLKIIVSSIIIASGFFFGYLLLKYNVWPKLNGKVLSWNLKREI